MRSKVPLVVVASTLLLFAACSPTATSTPPATPPVETATPPVETATPAGFGTPGATETPSATASPTEVAGGCTDGATGTQTVTIKDFAFDPPDLGVGVGTTVSWANADATGHTATADDGSFDCRPIAGGASMSFTFTTPGTYAYHCAIHPTMRAKVTVT